MRFQPAPVILRNSVPVPDREPLKITAAFRAARAVWNEFRRRPKEIEWNLVYRPPAEVMKAYKSFRDSGHRVYLKRRIGDDPVLQGVCLSNFAQHFLNYAQGHAIACTPRGLTLTSAGFPSQARAAFFEAMEKMAALMVNLPAPATSGKGEIKKSKNGEIRMRRSRPHPYPQKLADIFLYNIHTALFGYETEAACVLARQSWEFLGKLAVTNPQGAHALLPPLLDQLGHVRAMRAPMREVLTRWMEAVSADSKGGIGRFQCAFAVAEKAIAQDNELLFDFALDQMFLSLHDFRRNPGAGHAYLKRFIARNGPGALERDIAVLRRDPPFLKRTEEKGMEQENAPAVSHNDHRLRWRAEITDVARWLYGQIKHPSYAFAAVPSRPSLG